MQVYREEKLTLDPLMAFAITDDHARQEQVFESLTYNRDPYIIRRELTRTHIAANDRRPSSSARKPIWEPVALSCAICSPRIGAASRRMPLCSTVW